MKLPQSGLPLDSPAWPLIQASITYQGLTTGAGNALGTNLVDALCGVAGLQPSYVGLQIKLLDGDAAGQVRTIATHVLATGTIGWVGAVTDSAGAVVQVVASTRFVILSSGGGGGAPAPVVAPSIGLWMFGVCDPAMVASLNTLLLTNLAGFPDDIFNGEFWIQVIHNDNAVGTAPEREWRRIDAVGGYAGATGTFVTDDFSANVEANDLVAVVHESIMGIEILGFGTLDTSSQTVPADSTRAAAYAWENNDYFKGCILMPTEGDCRFQPRPIASFTVAGGIFGLDEPFSQLPGTVDYVIIGGAYPVQRLLDIFNIVNAILVTTETSGTITTTGAEQDVYINNAPAGVYEPLKVQIDFTAQTAIETVVVRTYYRISSAVAAALIKKDEKTFVGIQDPPLINVELEPNRYGVWVSLQRTAGAAQDYDWAVFYRG